MNNSNDLVENWLITTDQLPPQSVQAETAEQHVAPPDAAVSAAAASTAAAATAVESHANNELPSDFAKPDVAMLGQDNPQDFVQGLPAGLPVTEDPYLPITNENLPLSWSLPGPFTFQPGIFQPGVNVSQGNGEDMSDDDAASLDEPVLDGTSFDRMARLEFADTFVAITTNTTIIGRDQRVYKRAVMNKKRAEGGLSPVSRTVPQKRGHYSKSYVSQEGGALGPESDGEGRSRSSKRRRTVDNGQYTLSPKQQTPAADDPSAPDNVISSRQYVDHTPGAVPVDMENLRPSSDDVARIDIHGAGPDIIETSKGISRDHLKIQYDEENRVWQATAIGRNGFFCEERLYHKDEVVTLRSGSHLQIQAVGFIFTISGVEDGKLGNEEPRAYFEDGKKMSLDFSNSRLESDMRSTDDALSSPVQIPTATAMLDTDDSDDSDSEAHGSTSPKPAVKDVAGKTESEEPIRPTIESDHVKEPMQTVGPDASQAVVPPKKRGPGRPPKNGVMSKREERELKKKREEEDKKNNPPQEPGNPPTKRKVGRPRKHPRPEDEGDQPEKRKYKPRKPKNEDGEDDEDPEGEKADKQKRLQKPKTPPLDLGKKEDFTEEQLQKPNKNYQTLIDEVLSKGPEDGLTLKQIYKRIARQYPYFFFMVDTKGWESSVRHNLIGSHCFEKNQETHLWKRVQGIPLESGKKRKPSDTAAEPRGPAVEPSLREFLGKFSGEVVKQLQGRVKRPHAVAVSVINRGLGLTDMSLAPEHENFEKAIISIFHTHKLTYSKPKATMLSTAATEPSRPPAPTTAPAVNGSGTTAAAGSAPVAPSPVHATPISAHNGSAPSGSAATPTGSGPNGSAPIGSGAAASKVNGSLTAPANAPNGTTVGTHPVLGRNGSSTTEPAPAGPTAPSTAPEPAHTSTAVGAGNPSGSSTGAQSNGVPKVNSPVPSRSSATPAPGTPAPDANSVQLLDPKLVEVIQQYKNLSQQVLTPQVGKLQAEILVMSAVNRVLGFTTETIVPHSSQNQKLGLREAEDALINSLRPRIDTYLRNKQAPSAVPSAAPTTSMPTPVHAPIPTDQAYIGGPAGQAILTAEAQTGRPLSEDCLSLNVWTKPQSGTGAPKAVLFWIFGGGFSIGNTACEIYDGSVLADENDVVVVSPNYRTNIFGFCAGLQQNVGLLDQRMALEWARDNVAAFGGDPSRITVFGQSAGGASTDYLNIMYPDDPIANGFIPQSGVASGAVGALAGTPEDAAAAWYNVSASAGCGGEEAGPRTLDCMRMKTTAEILGAVNENDLIAIQTGFSPVADDITAPSAAVDRINAGDFAKVPMLVGNVENEAGFIWPVLLAYTYFDKSTVDTIAPLTNVVQPILDIANLVGFTCGARQAAGLRVDQGVTAYRYRFYGGNYTNLYVNYVGSDYHTSELPVVFGTASWLTGIQDTPVQASMGAFMRNAWAEFARDPEDGLANLGWPKYDPDADTLARLAFEGETEPSYVDPDDTDTLCTPINFVLNRVTGSTSTVMSCLNSALMAVVTNGTQSEQVKQVLATR
ncbi:hypothetical protein SLS63_008947 [Diaporthe eres]|uniref:Fork-head domain-containing protein n=1 Tax=Diaporthe eres TaxID=83184 RepID=A0ABR1P122_DIAER